MALSAVFSSLMWRISNLAEDFGRIENPSIAFLRNIELALQMESFLAVTDGNIIYPRAAQADSLPSAGASSRFSDESLHSVGGTDRGSAPREVEAYQQANTRGDDLIEFHNPHLDLVATSRWIEQLLPFILLLSLVFIYEHYIGIIVFLWLTAVLYQVNEVVRHQTSAKERRGSGALCVVVSLLSTQIASTYFMFRAERLWRHLVLVPPSGPLSLWHACWIVAITDLMARFISMIIKATVMLCIGTSTAAPHSRKGEVYSTMEAMMGVYRLVLPVPVWYMYLVDDRFGHVFSSLITGLYLAMKLTLIVEKSKLCAAAVRALVMCELRYGKYASKEEIVEVGDVCVICHDKLRTAVVLDCSHLFCHECLCQWFERERTCPLCRAVIPTAGHPTHTDGTTSLFVQLF